MDTDMTAQEMVLKNLEVFGAPEGRATGYVFARPDEVEETEGDVWQAWTSDAGNLL